MVRDCVSREKSKLYFGLHISSKSRDGKTSTFSLNFLTAPSLPPSLSIFWCQIQIHIQIDGQLKPQLMAVDLRLRGSTRPSYSISHHKTWIWFWRMFNLTSSLMVETLTSSLSMTVSSLSSYKVFCFLALLILSCFYTQVESIFLVLRGSDSGRGSLVLVRSRDWGTKISHGGSGLKKFGNQER